MVLQHKRRKRVVMLLWKLRQRLSCKEFQQLHLTSVVSWQTIGRQSLGNNNGLEEEALLLKLMLKLSNIWTESIHIQDFTPIYMPGSQCVEDLNLKEWRRGQMVNVQFLKDTFHHLNKLLQHRRSKPQLRKWKKRVKRKRSKLQQKAKRRNKKQFQNRHQHLLEQMLIS